MGYDTVRTIAHVLFHLPAKKHAHIISINCAGSFLCDVVYCGVTAPLECIILLSVNAERGRQRACDRLHYTSLSAPTDAKAASPLL